MKKRIISLCLAGLMSIGVMSGCTAAVPSKDSSRRAEKKAEERQAVGKRTEEKSAEKKIEKKTEEKKTEEKKTEEKKTEKKQTEEKKSVEKKSVEKKQEEKKSAEKKTEKKTAVQTADEKEASPIKPESVPAPESVAPAEQPAAESGAPAGHVHNWVLQTRTVHHDAAVHTEQILVREAYEEPVYEEQPLYEMYGVNICSLCGKDITGREAEHGDPDFGEGCTGSWHYEERKGAQIGTQQVQVGTISHPAVYDTIIVTDQEAYDETVADGYRCDQCGAVK